MATFGNSAGTSTAYTSVLNTNLYGEGYTTPSDMGTVTKLSFYGRSSASTRDVKGVIVNAATETIVTNGVSDVTSGVSTTLQWWDLNYSTPPTVSANTKYYFCLIPSSTLRFYYTAFDGDHLQDTTNNYSTPTNPTDAGYSSNLYEIYVTYSPSGTTSASPKKSNLMLLGVS